MSSTTILNEILQKLSKVATENELIQEPSVQEEVVEAATEATEEVKEETTELSEETVEAPIEEVEASAEEVEAQEEENLMEGYVSEEKYQQDMAALMAEIEAIKKMIDEEMGYMKKEKDMLSEQVKELSKEPAAEAIKHNPEGEAPKKFNFTYGQNKPQNTFDRVMARISNKQ